MYGLAYILRGFYPKNCPIILFVTKGIKKSFLIENIMLRLNTVS